MYVAHRATQGFKAPKRFEAFRVVQRLCFVVQQTAYYVFYSQCYSIKN